MQFIKRFIWVVLICSCSAFAAAPTVDFTLNDISGKQHHLSDYRGKWVIVNYWATWCPPCLDEIPELSEFHEKHHAKDAVVLGINYEEDIDIPYLRKFIDEYLISYPILRGDPDGPAPLGQIYGLPSTFIISPDGEVVSRKVGGITQAQLEDFLRQNKSKLPARKKV